MNIDLTEIFDADLGGRPATFTVDATDADSDTSQITVVFNRDAANTLGGQNASPEAWARTADVAGITNKSGLTVHYGYLTDEAGNRIQDEAGEDIIAENEFTYKVTGYHNDAHEVTKLMLSLVTPRTT